MREQLIGKIHQATVTQANVNYVGSITIDANLLEKSGIWAGQKVLVVSNTSGARLETYTIAGQRGSGIIGMNGAAAHLIKTGEEIIIIAFASSDKPLTPKCILVDAHNQLLQILA